MQKKTALKNVIYPEDVTPPNYTTVLQKYRCANFGPLNQAEARKCLRSFIVGAKSALDELHGIGLSHNDIRLPNFCFNANFEVILIDLDRVWLIGKLYHMFYKEEKEGRSCMYKVDSNCYNGKHTVNAVGVVSCVGYGTRRIKLPREDSNISFQVYS